ncbi:MAG: autotransporter assembly complex family protein [Pseudomonadota bacterium]
MTRPATVRLRHVAALLAFLLAVTTPTCGFAQADGLTYRISGVDGELRDNLRAHLGESPRSREAAERFIVAAPQRAERALEALGYYQHSIAVEVDRSGRPWRAQFEVNSGEVLRYSNVAIELTGAGADTAAFQTLLNSSAPKKGGPVHHGHYESFKASLQQLARQLGYFDAALQESRIEVEPAAERAELTLRYSTGPRYRFGELKADDEVLAPQFLARLLPYDQSGPYSQAGLLDLRQRLLRLGYFSGVVVLPELDQRADGRVPIRVEATPAPAHSYELGVGYSTDTQQRFSLLWRSPKLNNRGHSQQTSLRWSPINPELRTIYSIPLDDPANDLLQFVGRLEANEYGDLESNQREVGLRREQTTPTGVRALGLRLLREDWSALSEDFDAEFVLLGGSFSRRQRRGDAVDPESGFSQYYEFELASSSLGSDEDLLRLRAELLGVRRFFNDWRLVARAEAGYLRSSSQRPDEIPPSLAFFAGGDHSIRGYAYQSVGRELTASAILDTRRADRLVVGGTRLLTSSLELQRYVTPQWRVAAFVDAGDAFVESDFELNVGVGFGIHYLSPVGALRLEVADPVTSDDRDWRVHINIGAEF